MTNVDVRFVAPGARGHLRLLSGMVLANRPWRLFPSFKGALAAAFATAAYVLVIPTIWMVADAVGWARLLALMVAAIVAMVVWIIVAHHLWERLSDRELLHWAALYNGVTVPVNPQTSRRPQLLRDLGLDGCLAGHGGGALGASLEHEDKVREAAYGYRQRRRQEANESEES